MSRYCPLVVALLMAGCMADTASNGPIEPPGVVNPPPTSFGRCAPETVADAFASDVFAKSAQCQSCHAPGSENRTAPKWMATGADAARETMYDVLAEGYVDIEAPAASLLLTRPLAEAAGGTVHGGGEIFASTDDETYVSYDAWIRMYADCYADANQPPIPNAGVDRVIMEPRPGEGVTIMLDGSGSMDPDGSIERYTWSWSGGSMDGMFVTLTFPVGVHVVELTVTDDAGMAAKASVTITVDAFPSECSDTTALDIYTQRVEPLVTGGKPSSCNQCHLSGVDLASYVQDTPCQTMACLMEQGEVDFAMPEASKILERIERAEPESELITPEVIQAEYDGFLQWITFSSVCQDALCGEIQDACQSGIGNVPPSGAPTPLGQCDEESIVDSFATKVFVWRGRCEGCHTPGAMGQCRPQWNGVCAPGFIDDASPQVMAANTMYNLIGLGSIDPELPPAQNSVVTKPLAEANGGDPHLGGDKMSGPGDPAYDDFIEWLGYYQDCYNNGIQQPPLEQLEVRITNPPNGATVNGNRVFLQGHATDPEDGELGGESLVWRSSRSDNPLGTGPYLAIPMPSGQHRVWLIATDSDGNVREAAIDITVN